MDIIRVVCGVVKNDGNVFICRRNTEKSLAGYWEFPGGKIEKDETHEEALKRELFEELQMLVEVKKFIGESSFDYGDYEVKLYCYLCDLINYEDVLKDHDSFNWVLVDDLTKYKLAPADIPFIEVLRNEHTLN